MNQINRKLIALGKRILSKIIPDSNKIRYISYLPKLNSMRKTHIEKYPIFKLKNEMYGYINSELIKNGSINYLEFGVFKGDSIRYWSIINTNSESIFYGFDTFTGLPSNWDNFIGSMAKNSFDVGGTLPQINDQRVTFIKGMFQDTLPEFLKDYSANNQLIIHNDSDLYSSTLYVLTEANSIIKQGTVIIFDEFSSMLHEFRALEDYCSSYLRTYEIIAATSSATDYFSRIAIRIK